MSRAQKNKHRGGHNRTTTKRFWSKVQVSGTDDCWPYQGTRLKNHYGMACVDRVRILAHRHAFNLFYGTELPRSICVLHTCDNRRCVNPNHLFIGNNKDNSEDMVRKGRSLRGEKANGSKLKEADVLGIRNLYKNGKSLHQLEQMFKSDYTNIHLIVRGRTWKHVGGPISTDPLRGARRGHIRCVQIEQKQCPVCKNMFSMRASKPKRMCSKSCAAVFREKQKASYV